MIKNLENLCTGYFNKQITFARMTGKNEIIFKIDDKAYLIRRIVDGWALKVELYCGERMIGEQVPNKSIAMFWGFLTGVIEKLKAA